MKFMKSVFFRFSLPVVLICTALFFSCQFIPESLQTETVAFQDILFRRFTPKSNSLTIDLGETPKTVYLSVVNSDFRSSLTLSSVTVTQVSGHKTALPAPTGNAQGHINTAQNISSDAADFHERLNELNRTALRRYGTQAPVQTQKTVIDLQNAPRQVDPNQQIDKKTFYNGLGSGTTINATRRATAQDGAKTLSVYVDDAARGIVDEKNTSVLAESFLKTGQANDIYDWITGIFGEEWGNHSYEYLIPKSNNITILIYDIPQNGVSGFFSSADLVKKTNENYSNESNLIYLDAQQIAADINAQKSTLAHELQHMIQFYQKSIKYNSDGLETWINEMCSLAAEDFVADKIHSTGPRGTNSITSQLPNPVPPGTKTGVLPLSLVSDQTSLVNWNASNTLPQYARSYAFGAYLARNYGGAQLYKNIVQNSYTNQDAVTEAIKVVNPTLQNIYFFTLLEKWALSTLISDKENLPTEYKYNNGSSWFTSYSSGIQYNLGSINLWNYSSDSATGTQNGPLIHPISSSPTRQIPPAGVNYYELGQYNGTINVTLQSASSSSLRVTVLAR